MFIEGAGNGNNRGGAQAALFNAEEKRKLLGHFRDVLIPPIYIWNKDSPEILKIERPRAAKHEWLSIFEFLRYLEKDLKPYGNKTREELYKRIKVALTRRLTNTSMRTDLGPRKKQHLDLDPNTQVLALYTNENTGLVAVRREEFDTRVKSCKTRKRSSGLLAQKLNEEPKAPVKPTETIDQRPFGSMAGGLSSSVTSVHRRLREKLHGRGGLSFARRASSRAVRRYDKIYQDKTTQPANPNVSRRRSRQLPSSPFSLRTIRDPKIFRHLEQSYISGISEAVNSSNNEEQIDFFLKRLFIPKILKGFLETFSDAKAKEIVNYELDLNSNANGFIKLHSFIKYELINDLPLHNYGIENLLLGISNSPSKLKHLLLPLGDKMKKSYLYQTNSRNQNPSLLNIITDLAFNHGHYSQVTRQIAAAFLYVMAVDLQNAKR